MNNPGPGKCVECFVPLEPGEIICGTCQDVTDGRNDHFFQIKYEKDKESNDG